MRTFATLDAKSGIIRRYAENARPTHIAILDPGEQIEGTLETFRVHPPRSCKVTRALPLLFPLGDDGQEAVG